MITFGEEAAVLYLYFIALWRYDEEYFVVYGFANAYGNNPHIKAFTLLIQIISFNFADIKANLGSSATIEPKAKVATEKERGTTLRRRSPIISRAPGMGNFSG